VKDEGGKTVNVENPIITEHNGTTGSTMVLTFTLENVSVDHYHRNIVLQVSPASPVEAGLSLISEPNPNYAPIKTITRLNPKEKQQFNLKTSVSPGTAEQIVRGASLTVSSTRYPVFTTK